MQVQIFLELTSNRRSLSNITSSALFKHCTLSQHFQFWKEPRIRWPKRYYGNISTIRATPEMIWTPDIQGPIGYVVKIITEWVRLLRFVVQSREPTLLN